MNYLLKKEFMRLNENGLTNYVSKITGLNLINKKPAEVNNLDDDATAYEIKYIDDDKYGFWCIKWDWKQSKIAEEENEVKGFFQNKLIIEPFKVSANYLKSKQENYLIDNYSLRKELEKYFNQNCPHFKQAFEEDYGLSL